MAENVALPEGFQLDNNLPPGFELDKKTKKPANKTLGVSRSALEGATLGFADEIGLGGAAVAAKLFNPDLTKGQSIPDIYKSMRSQYNTEQSQFQQENPKLAIGSTIAGGLLTAPLMGAKAAQLAKSTKSIWPLVKSGAGYGAVSGVGFAETPQDIPMSVVQGTAMGAATPLAMQGVANGARALGRGAKGLLSLPQKAFQSADDVYQQSAANQVAKAFQRDSRNIGDAFEQAGKLGPEAVLADVGGENVRKLAQNVASLPGKSAEIAETTLQSRMNRSVPRILTALKKSFGSDKTVFKTTKDLLEKRSAQAGPLYKSAETQSVSGQKIGEMLLGLSDDVANAKGTKIGGQLKAVLNSLITKDGSPKTAIKDLHWAKLDLDSKIGTAFRNGDNPLGTKLLEVKRNLLSVMDDVPDYAKARKIFSDDSSVIGSIKRGKAVLSTEPEQMAEELSQMSKADVDGFLIGAREAIANAIKKTPEGGNSARRVASYALRERLAQAFPDEQSLNKFMQALDVEDTFAQLRNVATRGSQTQPRVSSEAVIAASAATDAFQGRFVSVVMGKIAQFINNYKHIPEPVRDEIGKMLLSDFSKTGKASKKLLMKLAKQQIRKDQIDDLVYSINSTLSRPLIAGEQKATN